MYLVRAAYAGQRNTPVKLWSRGIWISGANNAVVVGYLR